MEFTCRIAEVREPLTGNQGSESPSRAALIGNQSSLPEIHASLRNYRARVSGDHSRVPDFHTPLYWYSPGAA
jgi:hypothetical protein